MTPLEKLQDRVKAWELNDGDAWVHVKLGELRAALSSGFGQREDGWRPIEEAPRDGTPVLVWQGDRRKWPGDRQDDPRWAIGYWRVEEEQADRTGGSWGDRNHAECAPTHFKPLPPPPTAEGGEG